MIKSCFKYYMGLFCFILLFPGMANSQAYVAFPTDSAAWITYQWFLEWDSKTDMVYLNGDTTINSLTYHKLYVEFYNGQNDLYIGAIREDSLKRVYFFNGLDPFSELFPIDIFNNEELLYQFGLNIGDTIFYNLYGHRVIVGIDSVYVNGEFRKRYRIEGGRTLAAYWIEGIGSVKGLLGPYSFEFENSVDLTCFLENWKPIWPDTTCYLISSMGEKIASLNKVKVFPNPGSDEITIEGLSFRDLGGYEFRLYSVFGRNVLISQLDNEPMQIDVSGLESGVYFYRIHKKDPSLKMPKGMTGKVNIQ